MLICTYTTITTLNIITPFISNLVYSIYEMKIVKPTINILLVEDNDLDAFVASQMLSIVSNNCQIKRFSNGIAAIDYLKNQNNLIQWLIVLDINMPTMNGIEFLEKISQSEELKKLTVTILSSSENPVDIALCKDYGVHKYYMKPLTVQSSNEIIDLATAG